MKAETLPTVLLVGSETHHRPKAHLERLGMKRAAESHGRYLVLSEDPATSLAIITLQRLQGDQGERTRTPG